MNQGSKKLDPTKTGKFGLGFNSVYHLVRTCLVHTATPALVSSPAAHDARRLHAQCDVPMFVSGEFFVALDPQRKFVPGLAPGMDPGLRTKIADEEYASLRDQFDPFKMPCYGCDLESEPNYSGTLFRFPLRSVEHATHTELRPGCPGTTQRVLSLFEDFESQLIDSLLFLENVQEVTFHVWHEGAAAPELLRKVKLHGPDAERRGILADWLRTRLAGLDSNWKTNEDSLGTLLRAVDPASVPRETLKLLISDQDKHGSTGEHEFWVRTGTGRSEAWRVATGNYPGRQKPLLWPGAAVAVCVRSPDRRSASGFRGRACATLPIRQLETGYPVHVNARWALTDNRCGPRLHPDFRLLCNRACS